MTTYCINTMGGRHARWIPSEEEAKARWLRDAADVALDNEEPIPEITFERTSECDGEVTEEHISILEDGHEVACIWPEKLAWPEVGGPSLAMITKRVDATCHHALLVCKMDGDPRESVPRPVIVCSDCGAEWKPSGL